MTSQAPAAGESLVGHLHGPEPDLVNRAVDLRVFEPLTSAVQAPARVDGATASKGVVTSALFTCQTRQASIGSNAQNQ